MRETVEIGTIARLTVRELADAAGCAAGGIMTRSNLRFALASTLLPLLLLTMAGQSRASTITVSSLLDTGSGTLRDAINVANSFPTIPATINFSVSGTITLGSALPAIANTSPGALTINGGNTITIDGAHSFQIFSVNAGATLSLQNLTIANANATSIVGGGVTNLGTLTVNNCTLSGNSAVIGGGILNQGTMTVTNSTFADNIATNGGAIDNNNTGVATIINSTFSGNHGPAAASAGIVNSGQMTAAKGAPLIVSNGASASVGGAIVNIRVMTITNSTFSGNEVTTSTATALDGIAENGGAIFNTGTLGLKSTILADSVGGNCEGGAPANDAGYNISDDDTCPTTSGTSVDSSTTLNLSPAGLANNGGPTDTIALEPNSQAVDFIPVAACTDQSTPTPLPVTTDQRGEPRPDLGNLNFCDVGAYELQTSYDFALESDRVQIARSSAANADLVNMGLTFSDVPNPTCASDDDVLNNGLTVQLFADSCSDLMGTGLTVDLDPFVVHTVNHQSYGTFFQSSPPETVSARMVALPTPAGTCGEWMLNLEVAGLDTPALGLGGTNPFSLILESTDLHMYGCFDITSAIVGNQIDPPSRTVRRGVRR